MLTSFDQVREWITDNGFKRWVLYRDRSKTEKILDSATFPSDTEDKLVMTEKYLRLNGGHAYAVGAGSNATSDLSTVCEISLGDSGAAGVGNTQYPPLNIGEIEDRIRKQLKAEIEAEKYKNERIKFEEEKKEFEEQRNGVIGAIVGYVAPYLPILKNLQSAGRMVAGIDTEEPVHAHKVQPIIPKEETHEQEAETVREEEVFTDAEGEELFDLMKRFKAVEPENWLKMLRTVVTMAESGDAAYNMAKGVLIK